MAAILSSSTEAAEVFATMPGSVQEVSTIHSRSDLSWPCFLVEDDGGLWFCSPEEAQARLVSSLAAGKLDDDDRRVTVYHLVGAFHPEIPGRDEMGRLDHTHPGAREASQVVAAGWRALWGE